MRQRRSLGFSLPELLVTLAATTIMAGVAIAIAWGFRENTARQVCERNLNLLNGAVNAFNNGSWELVLAPANDTSDEMAIFYTLQHRDAQNPVPGSPYLQTSLPFVASSSAEKHRARWNGRYFEFLPAGSAGSGLDLEALSTSTGNGPATGFTPVPPSP